MSIRIGGKALITTNEWFVAPDGRNYRAVFGTVNAVKSAEDVLGIKTNSKSTNWYVEIGNMTVAGCQIHYAIRTDDCSFAPANDWTADAANGLKLYEAPSKIYNADI